ncbi:MAG: shikimate kinase [Thermodesulfobacteriota bacterium]
MNLFLIGYRCTGKTRVGKSLAERLGRPFLDTDAELVRETGRSISEMVDRHGWDFFRQQERRILQRMCQKDDHVIATGGGIILDPRNVADMGASGRIVWLRAHPATIADRMGGDSQTRPQRPSLTGKTPVEEIEETLTERLPLYESAMHTAVDTDGLTIDEITDLILTDFPQLTFHNL